MIKSPLRLAVLVSGSGTTLQNLIDEIKAGRLEASIELVVGSRAALGGVRRAEEAGIPHVVVDRREYSASEFSRRVFEQVDGAGVDLVCLAGWLCLLEVPDRYVGKVMNIHPALLPSFGGKGMYGKKVHQEVLEAGAQVSGCTVHFVDQEYDSGPIILQRKCAVIPGDTAESLGARVFEEEKVGYPEAVRLFGAGKLRIEGRRVIVLP